MLQTGLDVTAVWFSPDGQQVATVGQDNTTRFQDRRTGKGLTNGLESFSEFVPISSARTGNGSLLSQRTKTARVWDRATGKPLTEPFKHDGPIASAQFSSDGNGSSLHRWTRQREFGLAHRQPLMDPLNHDGQVNWASFSPDGRWAITTSGDRRSRVWELPFAPLPVPSWLPEMAEAISGQRLNEDRVSEPVLWNKLLKFKEWLAGVRSLTCTRAGPNGFSPNPPTNHFRFLHHHGGGIC